MEINNKILQIIKEENIPEEGILYLMSVYFNLTETTFDDVTTNKVNNLKFFDRDLVKDKINWNVPLFGDSTTKDFIETYRDLFYNVDKTSAGDRPTVIKKFKKFYTEYPQYSHKQILKATELYLDYCVEKGEYIQKAHYFIKKERNPEGSKLLSWLEILDKETKTRKLYGK